KGRANYEPNSLALSGEEGGPREDPKQGFTSLPAPEAGDRLRVRPSSFADHYSQPRMFYRSLLPPEQAHIASPLTVDLSKVELTHVRVRVVAALRQVDEDLAGGVARWLASPLPPAASGGAPAQDLPLSPALRIIGHMEDTLEGRTVGILVDDGSDG